MKYRVVEHVHGVFEAQVGNDANEWRHVAVFKSLDEATAKLAEIHDKGFTDFVLVHEVEFANDTQNA